MSRIVALLTLLSLTLPVWPQDDKQAQKDMEKKVADAIKAFKKEYTGTDVAKVDAIAKLVASINDKAMLEKFGGLVYEKVVPELTPCLKEADMVRKKAIEAVAGMDHPMSGDALAGIVADCIKSKDLAQALVKACDKCKWQNFLGEMSNKLLDKCFDKDLSPVCYEFLGVLERVGPISAVDGLIKLLKKIEDNNKNSATPNDGYAQQVVKACKSCTGEDKATSKDYEVWWKANKDAVMSKARLIHWCSLTAKRWDSAASDSKAYCPNHGDKKLAGKDKPIIALVTLK